MMSIPYTPSIDRISIRPGVSVLSVLRHLNYRPWFALAEFLDNSIQSFLANRSALSSIDGQTCQLRVSIDIDPDEGGRITIRDNAAGIGAADYARAFRPAQLPADRSGLAEFGMGMKSAACWFASSWQVRTSALGEATERIVAFDIDQIVNDEVEELDVIESFTTADTHFTEITLLRLHKPLAGRTLGKMREHLQDIYRVYTRGGNVVISFNGEELTYAEPAVLVIPRYNENHEAVGEAIRWRLELDDFDMGDGLRVRGFAALRHKASTRYAGFSLFRRNRLIEGSGDNKYRPQAIFGTPNDFVYQRLFGELHLEGFEVSHTKDGFRWDENEEPFLELLKERLNDAAKPLIRQARNYRARPAKRALRAAAEASVEGTAQSLEQRGAAAVSSAARDPVEVETPTTLGKAQLATQRVVDLTFEDRRWRIILELSDDPAVGEWFEISEAVAKAASSGGRELPGLRLSLRHPFMERFVGADADRLEPVVRVACALGLAEKVARDSGVEYAGTIRHKLNKILRLALARR